MILVKYCFSEESPFLDLETSLPYNDLHLNTHHLMMHWCHKYMIKKQIEVRQYLL